MIDSSNPNPYPQELRQLISAARAVVSAWRTSSQPGTDRIAHLGAFVDDLFVCLEPERMARLAKLRIVPDPEAGTTGPGSATTSAADEHPAPGPPTALAPIDDPRPYSLGLFRGERYIECHTCHRRSFNANDIDQLYCGHCHRFQHQPAPDRLDAGLGEIRDEIRPDCPVDGDTPAGAGSNSCGACPVQDARPPTPADSFPPATREPADVPTISDYGKMDGGKLAKEFLADNADALIQPAGAATKAAQQEYARGLKDGAAAKAMLDAAEPPDNSAGVGSDSTVEPRPQDERPQPTAVSAPIGGIKNPPDESERVKYLAHCCSEALDHYQAGRWGHIGRPMRAMQLTIIDMAATEPEGMTCAKCGHAISGPAIGVVCAECSKSAAAEPAGEPGMVYPPPPNMPACTCDCPDGKPHTADCAIMRAVRGQAADGGPPASAAEPAGVPKAVADRDVLGGLTLAQYRAQIFGEPYAAEPAGVPPEWMTPPWHDRLVDLTRAVCEVAPGQGARNDEYEGLAFDLRGFLNETYAAEPAGVIKVPRNTLTTAICDCRRDMEFIYHTRDCTALSGEPAGDAK